MARWGIVVRQSRKPSTDTTGDGTSASAEIQEAQCRLRIADLDPQAVVVVVWSDINHSGYRYLSRSEDINGIIGEAKALKLDYVISYMIDRLARRVGLCYALVDQLQQAGIRYRSVVEDIRYETDDGAMSFGLRALIAEASSRRHSRQVKDNCARAASRGLLPTSAPLGLNRDGSTNDAIVAIRRCAELIVTTDLAAIQIARVLSREGYRSLANKPISGVQVRNWMLNPAYNGRGQLHGTLYPLKHTEPAFSDQEWQAIQDAMARRAHANTIRTYRRTPLLLLSGLLYCGECGQRMYCASPRKAVTKDAPGYYFCSSHRLRAECSSKWHSSTDVDSYVEDVLYQIHTSPETWVSAALVDETPIAAPDTREEQIRAAEARLARLGRIYADGLIGDDAYAAELRTLRATLAELGTTPRPVVATPPDPATLVALLQDWPRLVKAMTLMEKRVIVQQLVSRVYVHANNTMRIEFSDLGERTIRRLC